MKLHTKYKNAEGKVVPGVTTVLNQLGWKWPALMAWQRKQMEAGLDPDKLRDKAANIGTLAHKMVENHVKGRLDTETDAVDKTAHSPNDLELAHNAFGAFLDWEREHKIVYLGSEIQVVSEKYQYGGTLDILAMIDDHRTLLDIKTSNGVWPDFIVQTAAYKVGYEETSNDGKIDRVMILRLGKDDGSFTPHRIPTAKTKAGWKVFKHCLELKKLEGILK